MAKLADALDLGSSPQGCRFNSCQQHHIRTFFHKGVYRAVKLDKVLVLKTLKNYLIIVLGCCIYSLGIALFLDPFNLAAGGVTGISIVIHHLVGNYVPWLTTGVIILILNVPLFILGAIFFGRGFMLSTIFATAVSSGLINLWTFTIVDLIPLPDNPLFAALFGGALYGAGLGIIFKMGGSTAGTDIIVKILRKRFRYIQTSIISMAMDMLIVSIATIVFKDLELLGYTVISIIAFTFLFDWVLYGGNSAKLVYIITTADKSDAICDCILKQLEITATLFDGKGAYTGSDRRILLCAVKSFLFPKLRDIIRENDPRAFIIVTSAKEIYGEGYMDHEDGEL